MLTGGRRPEDEDAMADFLRRRERERKEMRLPSCLSSKLSLVNPLISCLVHFLLVFDLFWFSAGELVKNQLFLAAKASLQLGQ